MIDPDTRQTIARLHERGMSLRDISRRFHISRGTVRQIVRQQGQMLHTVRKDKIRIDPELLGRLVRECDGWLQRVHERLLEEVGVQVSYPTLTRLVRELDLGQANHSRCDRVPDEPGLEMQHDTSDYRIRLADQPIKLIASSLYLRYSKRRYLKFYRVFNRFAMKCFLHEALKHWGYSARQCIIDNTNLARLRGTGKRAVIVPEMAAFAQRYRFEFLCHEVNHSNRKAGEERSFRTVETNFFPGRRFQDLEDLNRQAFQWATVRWHHRAIGRTGLIPAKAFEHERPYLLQLPDELPAPYCNHERDTDQYGYAPFQGNHYWVPGSRREAVKLLQYADRVKIYRQRECVGEYPLPAHGVKNQRFAPEGQPLPRHPPRRRPRDSSQEEKRLRSLGPDVVAYLEYAWKSAGIQRHRFVRELFAMSRQVPERIFVQTLQRALRYRVLHKQTLHRIAWFCMTRHDQHLADIEADVDERFHERPAYQEGCLTDEPDLSVYDSLPPDDPDPDDDLDPLVTESESPDE
jgi:transposase